MDWLNLHIPTQLRHPAYIGSSPTERGTWLSVLAYGCTIECGGVLVGAGSWKDRQWQQACGVTLREVKACSRLLDIDGDDIFIIGYPENKEVIVQKNRIKGQLGGMAKTQAKTQAAAENGKLGGRPPKPKPNLSQNLTEGEGEGEGEGEFTNASARAHDEHDLGAPSPFTASLPRTNADRWRFEIQGTAWAQALIRVVKIGPENWPKWEGILGEMFGGDHSELVKFARTLTVERWPETIEAEWRKRRPDAVATTNGRKVVIL